MRRTLLGAVAVITLSLSAWAAWAEPVVYTGGKTGDYFLHFGPPLASVAGEAAWKEFALVNTKGAPDNMKQLQDNPEGVAILQGNVYGALANDPAYSNVVPVRAGVANEAVLAVMNPKLFERSKGSWDAVVAKAGPAHIRFVSSAEDSGPGRTFRQFQELDPRLKSVDVTLLGSPDDALSAVANGQADVALLVQFPNPENPRFKFIKDNNLKIAGVLFKQMRGLTVPVLNVSAFELCRGVTVAFTGGIWGFGQKAETVDTACTPLVYAVHKDADPDLVAGIKDAPVSALVPQKGTSFGDVLAQIQVLAGDAANAALDAASQAGDAIAEQLK